MKKLACILLSILLLIGYTRCFAVISYPAGTGVRICYDRDVSSLFGSYWIEGEALEEYAMELIENHVLPTGGA
jgi:hypothetical protein